MDRFLAPTTPEAMAHTHFTYVLAIYRFVTSLTQF